MDVLARLDAARAEINVLEHPFYRRWSAGELSAGELARYAGEYGQAVRALAQTSARAAESAAAHAASSPTAAAHRAELASHAQEESAHVQLWQQFEREAANRAGSRASAQEPEPLPATRQCVQAWSAGGDLLEQLAVLYAIEAGQPEISATKLAGLGEHYGFTREGPATEYFRVHEVRDVEHAQQARELIAQLMAELPLDDDGQAAERMLSRAREALHGNWLLLDGVEALSRAV